MYGDQVNIGMPREADKHIRVTEETWTDLNSRKRPGDSFDDVIQRLLGELDSDEKETEAEAEAETDGGQIVRAN